MDAVAAVSQKCRGSCTDHRGSCTEQSELLCIGAGIRLRQPAVCTGQLLGEIHCNFFCRCWSNICHVAVTSPFTSCAVADVPVAHCWQGSTAVGL
jgi:hypothetical protein